MTAKGGREFLKLADRLRPASGGSGGRSAPVTMFIVL